jgi:hypothetical protein
MNARIICGRKVQPVEIGCDVASGAVPQASIGSASEKYLRADREHQVEKVGWRATRNANAEQIRPLKDSATGYDGVPRNKVLSQVSSHYLSLVHGNMA